MIGKIRLHNVATYSTPVEVLPKKLNFIYGSNGSGKTTISNLMGDYFISDDCFIEMNNPSITKTLVYNKKFVEVNFSQSSSVKGIFTLGEDSIAAQQELEKLNSENQEKLGLIGTKEQTVQNFKNELSQTEIVTMEKCWKIQQNIGADFSNALVGYRNSKKKFFENCLNIYEEWDNQKTLSIEELKENYDIAYSKESQIYSTFQSINLTKIDNIEKSDLLQKVITGSSDTPIGQFIEFLKNSDWVQQGIEYISISGDKCPFCQQLLPKDLQSEIIDYFDEEYKKDCQSVEQFISNYNNYFSDVVGIIQQINLSTIPIIDISILEPNFKLFVNQLKLNSEELKKKMKAPSNRIAIDSLKDLLEKMNQTIELYNQTIISNNDIVKNQELERKKCMNGLWKYIVSELESDLEKYLNFVNGRHRAIASIEEQIQNLKNEIKDNNGKIESLEATITSVAPTVTEINKILAKFDFKGFYLQENQQKKGSYLILREDGTNAQNTLSEGEYNFITFLYFYYLVYGSQEKTGIVSNKIVVIDDPISSLDSNVLFIVSTLVKNLINDCRANAKGILQTFILTHNVYFHKEITFLGSRKQFLKEEVLFGIVRKKDNVTTFHTYDKNPIESTYQLMWRELNSDKISTVTAFNTMRRILEYYFKIIGDMDYERCINEFDGTDKMVCKSLVSCINDGSHFISDDFVIAFDEENIESYERIFRLVFEKLNHIQHYNMMKHVPSS